MRRYTIAIKAGKPGPLSENVKNSAEKNEQAITVNSASSPPTAIIVICETPITRILQLNDGNKSERVFLESIQDKGRVKIASR
jgi:hypothetical protein